MGYKNILVPYDGSEGAEHALAAAHEMITHNMGEKIVALAVFDPSENIDPSYEVAARMAGVITTNDVEDKLIRLKQKVEAAVSPYKDNVDVVLKVGRPHKEIIIVAKEYKCGLIVMGSRGLGPIRGALGSVSHSVLREADVPVFITK